MTAPPAPALLERSALWRRLAEPALLVAILALLLALCGWILAEGEGVLASLAMTLVLVAALRLAPSSWVLSVFNAAPLRREEAPALFAAAGELCRRAGIEHAPRIFLARTPLLLAATLAGAGPPTIVLGRKVLRALTPRELRAVLAHEIAHLAHRDLALMQLGRALALVTGALARFALTLVLLQLVLGLVEGGGASGWELAALFLAPLAANLVLLALSRNREFDADAAACRLTGDPEALAAALLKLERIQAGLLRKSLPALARLPLPRWLRTHPSSAERIERLQPG
jgi:heat shock protein HtpX